MRPSRLTFKQIDVQAPRIKPGIPPVTCFNHGDGGSGPHNARVKSSVMAAMYQKVRSHGSASTNSFPDKVTSQESQENDTAISVGDFGAIVIASGHGIPFSVVSLYNSTCFSIYLNFTYLDIILMNLAAQSSKQYDHLHPL